MTALLVVFMFVGFALLDVVVRGVGRRIDERRVRRERAAVLATAVQIDYASDAPTLKRVRVPLAHARILAVDDEAIILDSFRKILVLAGYDVDTVESGREALGLVQRDDYDFVFTDLKMPGLDGVEVVKGVKQLRPDVDVAVITGYATIESAVATMQHGAADYIQKPFTEDELLAFVRRLRIRRELRQDAARRPAVRLVGPAVADEVRPHEYLVVGGAFFADGHSWARIEPSGLVRIGLDDFARRAIESLDGVDLPATGDIVGAGRDLFSLRRRTAVLRFAAPVGGKVVQVNSVLLRQPGVVVESPYDDGWVCVLQPTNLAGDLKPLRIGQTAVDWYQGELERLREAGGVPLDWDRLQHEFLSAGVPAAPALV
jgi:CheY-like chemotaxis protein